MFPSRIRLEESANALLRFTDTEFKRAAMTSALIVSRRKDIAPTVTSQSGAGHLVGGGSCQLDARRIEESSWTGRQRRISTTIR
ncbi:unnamed protein product [Sphagnum jensenii]